MNNSNEIYQQKQCSTNIHKIIRPDHLNNDHTSDCLRRSERRCLAAGSWSILPSNNMLLTVTRENKFHDHNYSFNSHITFCGATIWYCVQFFPTSIWMG